MTEASAGSLVGIYLTAQRATPMVAHNSALVVEGKGLDGDRYAAGTGTYSARSGPGRHVTLVEREALAAVAAETGIALAENESRRNLVTEGVALLDLVGQTFRVGDVVLRGVRPCPPCAHLERLTRPGVLAALLGRGGLRADVVSGSLVRLGDRVASETSVVVVE